MIECLDDVLARCNVDPSTQCWHWQGACRSKTHTPLFYNPATRKMRPGRHVVWSFVNGPVPKGMYMGIRKRCDPDCLNPSHLLVLTRSQYMRRANSKRDASAISRLILASRRRPDRKLDIEKARAIRARLAAGVPPKHVAAEFGVSRSNVNLVKSNRIWRDATPWGL